MTEASDALAESQETTSLPPCPLASVRQQVWPALVSVPILTLATGAAFPLFLAILAQPLFPHQSNGSLLSRHGHTIGSALLGQEFANPSYFHPRPSAAGTGYDALSSGGSNLSPSNPSLRVGVRQLVEDYRRRNELPSDAEVPIDAVTHSGSGLDPHISPANAVLQVRRIARVRGLTEERLFLLIAELTQDRQLGFLGEPRVCVLELNLALDDLTLASFASSAP